MQPLAEPWRLVAKPSCGRASSSRLTPAAIRPNERRERAFRAAANAVSAATVTPGASPRAFSAAFSRSSASLSLRGLLSAMRQPNRPLHLGPIPTPVSRNTRRPRTRIQPSGAALHQSRPESAFPLGSQLRLQPKPRGARRMRPASRDRYSTAPFAFECQSFLDNVIAV
jgi:hypothetical protein